ncbi:lysophospholipid acyltransferase family protein [soil metagenome]
MVLLPVILASFCGKITGGNWVYACCRLWADVWLLLIGIFHKNIYEEKIGQDRHYIFICNHISYMDIPVLLKTVRQPIRVLGKSEMEKIPVFGLIYKIAVVSVNRKDAIQRAESVRNLLFFLNRNISVFIFPEGTFNLTDKPLKEFYDGAFRIAIETATAIKPIVLLDTHRRLNHKSIFSLTPGISRAVHLKKIETDNYSMEDLLKLKETAYVQMQNALLHYKG